MYTVCGLRGALCASEFMGSLLYKSIKVPTMGTGVVQEKLRRMCHLNFCCGKCGISGSFFVESIMSDFLWFCFR